MLLWCSGWGCVVGSNFICKFQSTTGGWGPGRRWLLQREKEALVRALPGAAWPSQRFSVPVVNSRRSREKGPVTSSAPCLHPVSPQPLKVRWTLARPLVPARRVHTVPSCSSHFADGEMEAFGEEGHFSG